MEFDGHETDRRIERSERARQRLMRYGHPILSKQTIDRMVDEIMVETYENMVITRAKPRVLSARETDEIMREAEAIRPNEVKKLLREVREELGLPDFRHKEWKEIRA